MSDELSAQQEAGCQISLHQMQPWYWRSLTLANRTGSDVFAALFSPLSNPNAIATLLESPYPTPPAQPQLSRYSICAGAPRIIDGCPQLWTPPVGEILPFLEQLLQRGQAGGQRSRGAEGHLNVSAFVHPCSPSPHLPFTGGWLGWLGYDLVWEIEQLPYLNKDTLPFPVAYWYEPECFAVLDHWEQTLWLAATDPNQLDVLESHLERSAEGAKGSGGAGGDNIYILKQLASRSPLARLSPLAPSLQQIAPHFLTSQEDYESAVRCAKKYIQAGDIFQANLSLRFEATTASSSWAIYLALQQINPSPFASYWTTPWGAIISCSPERLVHLQKSKDGNRVSTRPIAGTRSRGATFQQDQQLAQDLQDNVKERAEHIMLVDLERNDLGRVCEWGSVAVDELLTIELYSHVMHLVSNITGTLRPEYNAVDLIRAVFPGGTITGCPKVRCMEIIEELEPVRRSLFYGSCGYLDWRGNLDLNILIRTLLFRSQESGVRSQESGELQTSNFSPGSLCSPAQDSSPISKVWGQVGAGIVADSEPQKEWYESLHKAQAQLTALKLGARG